MATEADDTPGAAPAPATNATDAPAAPPAPAPQTARGAVRRLLGKGLRAFAVLLVVVLVLVTAGTAWLAGTESGAQWALQRAQALLPGLRITGFSGRLIGGDWQLTQLEMTAGANQISIDRLALRGLRWHLRPVPRVWLGIELDAAEAGQVLVRRGPPGPPGPPPESLAFPLQLTVGRLVIDRVAVDALPPVTDIRARGLTMDSGVAGAHAVEQLALQVQGLAISGMARIGSAAPLALQTRIEVAPLQSPPWSASVQASGPLQALDVTATLRGPAQPGAPAPSLDLKAAVAPFAAWPLSTLQARTQNLDLSALAAGAPRTALTGTAELQARAADGPVSLLLDLSNSRPGRWDEGRLPVQRLRLDAGGSLDDRSRVQARRFELDLADGRGAAGRWTGQGLWAGNDLSLDTRLLDVRPQRLDRRAAAMRLSGPLALTLRGLPSPDPAASAATPPLSGSVKLQLDGQIEGAPQAVTLALEARGDMTQIEIERARAQAGNAIADLRATLRRTDGLTPPAPGQPAGADWQLDTVGSISDFDPLPWWPGEPGSAWRQGPHRLSAGWELALRAPGSAARLTPAALLQRVVGNGVLRVHDSIVAGVPLQARMTLGWRPQAQAQAQAQTQAQAQAQAQPMAATARADMAAGAAAPAGAEPPSRIDVDLSLGGNQLSLQGRGDPSSDGRGDRWQFELRAGLLSSLAPLARLVPAAADWVPRQGRLNADASASGRWPAMRSEGSAQLQQLQAGRLSLTAAELRWQLQDDAAQTVSLQAELRGASLDAQRLEAARASVDGTLAAHRMALDAVVLQKLPAPMQRVLALRATPGVQLSLRADGGWTAAPAGGGDWRVRVQRLALEGSDGKTLAPASPAAGATVGSAAGATVSSAAGAIVRPTAGAGAGPVAGNGRGVWVDTRNWVAELHFDAKGRMDRLRAGAGRATLAELITLRWNDVLVDLRGDRPGVQLQAEVDPVLVPPLLKRAQPGQGWEGDLRMGARLRVQAGEGFEAELDIDRRSGDLHLDGRDGLQLFGLTELRLAMQARDGVWNFRQALRGRTVGELGTNVRVRSKPENRWPDKADPVEGAIEARVADIGIWNAWIPPGWRLSGSLGTRARIAGTFGAPQFTGELSGEGLGLRNLLQGVAVSDGSIAIRLQGETARIERMTLRGGDGRIDITGGATLGSKPVVNLALQAERFRVLGRVDRQLIVSGDATLALSADKTRLRGALRVDEGLFDASASDAPALDEDVTVRRPGDIVRAEAENGAQRPRREIDVALSLDLGERLMVRGRGLDTTLRGNLRVSTPNNRLAINGDIRAERGTYAAYGQKLEIERGVISFNGPPDNPRLDVLALRASSDIRVGVTISGNLLTPRVRLFSDPEMSETDKLSWLILGRAPDGLGRTDTALLQRAAVALLAGEGEGANDQLMKTLGIDDLSLRQTDGDTRETVITLGKQLSRRWYVGYERGVNATTGTWQLIYRVAQRLTVRLQSGLDSSLDIIWIWRLGEADEEAVTKSIVTTPP